MTRRIFGTVTLAALAVFMATMILIMGALYDYFSGIQLRLRMPKRSSATSLPKRTRQV